MPIPEPGLYKPSNLTQRQKQDAIAALYGAPDMTNELTTTEIERMRQIVQSHDIQHKPMQTIDLNNPPKAPYRHQKFPLMVYDHANSYPAHEEMRPVRANGTVIDELVQISAKVSSMIVHSEEQLQRALAAGWSQDAPNFSEAPPEVTLEAEAERVQAQIDSLQRGRRTKSAA